MSILRDRAQAADDIARQAGDIALRHFGRTMPEIKPDASYVTEADRSVEAFIRERLGALYPDHAIIGEETPGGLSRSSEYAWAIDPIDGTTNFVAGLPHWAICIGLIHNGEPVAGAVYVPVLHEMYVGARGEGATLNGRALSMKGNLPPENEQLMAVWSTAVQTIDVEGYVGKFRILGSTVIKLTNLARDSYVASLTPTVHIWDVAAGLPVLWEAGAESRTMDGKPFRTLDMDPAHGFMVPPLVHALPAHIERFRTAVKHRGTR